MDTIPVNSFWVTKGLESHLNPEKNTSISDIPKPPHDDCNSSQAEAK